MAKISLKKKAGGTKVGNALRSVVGTAKGIIKSGNLQANAGASVAKVNNPLQSSTQKNQPVLKGTTVKGAVLNKAYVAPTVTGKSNGVTYYGGAGGATKTIPGLSGGAPINLGKSATPRTSSGSNNAGSVLGASSSNASTIQTSGESFTGSTTQAQTPSLGSNTPNLPSTNVIATPTLGAQNTPLTLPEKPVGDYSQVIPTTQEQAVAAAKDKTQTSLEDYLASIQDAPSSADAYQKAQRETEILQKQQQVNDLQGKLNAIVARGESQQLAQVGQGRGIPEAIIGGIQAQIGRETAIASLPVAAQLSAAQGDLEMANDNLDTLFKIYSEDATNEYNYRKEVKKAVYDFASAAEKRELEKMDKMEERAYQETQNLHQEQSAYAKMAFENGQSSLGAKIASLNYKSPTFTQELAKLQSQLRDPLKAIQLAKEQLEYNLLKNPTAAGIPKSLEKLSTPEREPLVNARATLVETEELKQIVDRNRGNLTQLDYGYSADAKRFRQLRSNVVDKLARERTGAVIGNDEKKAFKSILGVGLRSLVTKNADEVINGLNTFQTKHRETLSIIDPDGSIGTYLDKQAVNVFDQATNSSSVFNSSGGWTIPTNQ